MALVNESKTSNWNAASAVNVQDGAGDLVMYFNASYNGQNVNFGQSITNLELYLANKKAVDEDYETFKTGVLEDIGE